MKKYFLITFFWIYALAVFSQIPEGYYAPVGGKTGSELKTVLYDIINGHTTISYDALYNAYQTTDNISIAGIDKVYDMYSIKANGTADYYYAHASSDRCGNYSSEGDCYNREHSLPQSWFNSSSPMVSDLFHVYPTDGKVNGMRSSYPFGKVSNVTYTSSNGSKLGSSDPSIGYSGTVFEPIDEYKGDFARTYFYMATRYENVIANWDGNGSAGEILNGTAFPVFKDWYLNLMVQWHNQDPVSVKETIRNNAIYNIQHNRNPYIDHPEYVVAVWGGDIQLAFTSSAITQAVQNTAYVYNISAQGPAGETLTIGCTTKPAWLNISITSPGHAILSGTPTISDIGGNHVVLSLADGTKTVLQDFIITVSAALPLGFSSTPVTDVNQGFEYVYNITAQGASGTTYTFSCPTKPTWLSFQNISNGIAKLSGIPSILEIGDHDVVIAVSDGATTVNQEFTISVVEFSVVPGGAETFQNMPSSAGSYATRDWIGDNGISWHATQARTDLSINSRAICFEKSGNPYLQSATISGGVSQISFKHKQMYSTTGGAVTLFINDQQVGSAVSVSTAAQTAQFNGLNYSGSFTIKLVSNGVTQIGIDDLSWEGTTSSENVLPIITNVNTSPLEPKTGQTVTINASINDSDGTIQEAWVNWGDALNNQPSRVDMTLASGTYQATIPARSQTGTIYLTVCAKDNLLAVSSAQFSYLVSRGTYSGYEENNSSINVYPNPAKNLINIEVQDLTAQNIIISNIIGETMLTKAILAGKQQIDISQLKAGIYFIVVTGDSFRNTIRIVVY